MNQISFVTAGYCTHSQKMAWAGGTWKSVPFPATVAVIEHPTVGVVLFDTGYSERFYAETKKFPERLYSIVTPTFIDQGTTALAQLKKAGISARDVRAVILSHFHGDHIGAVADFPKATYYYLLDAYKNVSDLKGLKALRNAFLPGLLPQDFESRSKAIHSLALRPGPQELHGFGGAVDLFNDDSIWLVSMPGHTHGHAGLFVRTQSKDFLLAGDACYLRENYLLNSPSSQLTRLFVDDFSMYKKTLRHLHDTHLAFSKIQIVPCHCQHTLAELPSLTEAASHQTESNL